MKPYYQDDWATIYHGDAREIIDGLQDIDVMITDSPYGIDVGNNQSAKEKRKGLLVKKSYSTYKDTKENYINIVVPIIKKLIDRCKRSAVFGFAPNIFLFPTPDVIGGIFVPAGCGRNKWGWTMFMPIFFYGGAPQLNLGAKSTVMSSVDISNKNGHPMAKPTAWMNWLIDLATDKNDVVIDPFMGSGTTLVAAKSYGRKAIGIEIEEKYCEIAANRLRQEILPLYDAVESITKIIEPSFFDELSQ